MALVEIEHNVVVPGPGGYLLPVSGASVFVRKPDGTEQAVFTTVAGTVQRAQPLLTLNGRIEGWVEEGSILDLHVSGSNIDPYVQRFIAGGRAGPLGPQGVPGPSAADGSISVVKTGINDAGLARGAFSIYSTVATNIPNSVETVVPLAGVSFDVSGGGNGTGFVIPVTGVYRLTGWWRAASGLSIGTRVIPEIWLNGASRLLSVAHYSSGNDESFIVDGLAKLTIGNVVTLRARQDSGGAIVTQTGQLSTFLCGELVGRTT